MSAVSTRTRNQMKRMAVRVFSTPSLRKMMHTDEDRAWRCHAYAELLRRKHARS